MREKSVTDSVLVEVLMQQHQHKEEEKKHKMSSIFYLILMSKNGSSLSIRQSGNWVGSSASTLFFFVYRGTKFGAKLGNGSCNNL